MVHYASNAFLSFSPTPPLSRNFRQDKRRLHLVLSLALVTAKAHDPPTTPTAAAAASPPQCLGTYRRAAPTTTATPYTGKPVTFKKWSAAPSIGTSAIQLSVPLYGSISRPILACSWLVVEMPVKLISFSPISEFG